MTRRSGVTTRQMLGADNGAFYVWPNSMLGYPNGLSKRLLRDDLTIVSQRWLRPDNVRDRHVVLVIDHACTLSYDQIRLVDYVSQTNPKRVTIG